MALTGQQWTITAGEHEATVVEVGAGLRSYRHAGVDVTCPYSEDVLPPKCCGSPLVPWPNRLRNGRYRFDGADLQVALSEPATGNAIHGLARWARWSPVEHSASAVTLRIDLVPQTGWPFEVRVDVRYALGADGLTVTVTAQNTGTRRAPFGAGFHPYLSTRGVPLDDVELLLPAATRLLTDERQIPVGSQPVAGTDHDLRALRPLGTLRMDDCFTDLQTAGGRGVAELHTARGGAQLWFEPAFGHLQAFTLDPFPGLHTAGVALEPMSCAPDAFNSGDGLQVLEPGAGWSASWGITPIP
jgi:aldose 1-epimerase